MMRRSLFLLTAAAILASIPLFIPFKGTKTFGGADGEAESMIQQIQPDYRPWFRSVWQPPSAEIEGLLFALQAALGAGFLGYYLGLRRGETKGREAANRNAPR